MQRLLWLLAIIVTGLFVSVLLPTSVTAPKNPTDSRAVFLIDHGTHSSLAIETLDGQMLRYSYGDFRYYAERDTGLATGVAALLWPTAATLGRGELEEPALEQSLREQLVVVVEQVYPFQVSGARADLLITKLDEIYQRGAGELVEVPEYGLIFSPHPTDYFWGSNSSTMIGVWLKELGFEVFGWALLSSWSVTATEALPR